MKRSVSLMEKSQWDKNFALEQAGGDEELLQELLDIFKDSSHKDFLSIENGVKNKDMQLVCGAAHSIKGAAASLGMEAIRDVAYAIEKDCRAGSLNTAFAQKEELGELLQYIYSSLEK